MSRYFNQTHKWTPCVYPLIQFLYEITLCLWLQNLACGIRPGSSATTTVRALALTILTSSSLASTVAQTILYCLLFYHKKNTIARVWNEWLLYTSFKYFWNSKFSELKRVRPHTCWMKKLSLHVYLMRKSQSTAYVMKQFSTDKHNIHIMSSSSSTVWNIDCNQLYNTESQLSLSSLPYQHIFYSVFNINI